MRLLLTGGGTAGHVNPALAIAEIFLENRKDTELFFVGTPNGMERRLVEKAKIPYFPIEISGFKRSLSPHNIKALYQAAISPHAAKRLLKDIRPDLAIGTGGYVSWPTLLAASRLGIKTALHESNAFPGLATRKLAGHTDLVLLNFSSAKEHLPPCKTLHVGCPTLPSFCRYTKEEARKKLGIQKGARVIVSFGGSLGAAPLNHAALSLLKEYILKNPNICFMHGYGARYAKEFQEKLQKDFKNLPKRISFLPYLEDMPLRMSAADLLICRAGAMTLTEASLTHSPAILIPSPNVTADHQTKNAEAFQKAGGGVMIKEEDLWEGVLTDKVKQILENDALRRRMEEGAAAFSPPDANQRIYRALSNLLS